MTGIGGVPTLQYGPGDVALAHAADESVALDEVLTAAEHSPSSPSRRAVTADADARRGRPAINASSETRGAASERAAGRR